MKRNNVQYMERNPGVGPAHLIHPAFLVGYISQPPTGLPDVSSSTHPKVIKKYR